MGATSEGRHGELPALDVRGRVATAIVVGAARTKNTRTHPAVAAQIAGGQHGSHIDIVVTVHRGDRRSVRVRAVVASLNVGCGVALGDHAVRALGL